MIARLLKKGYQVTGSDFSEVMLQRASQQFPQATFIQKATTMIRNQAAFDGICSFNSTLYLDPVDLLEAIYRFHNTLKPGGLLFLFGFDLGPDWRGEPFRPAASRPVDVVLALWHGRKPRAYSGRAWRILGDEVIFKRCRLTTKKRNELPRNLQSRSRRKEELNQRQESTRSPPLHSSKLQSSGPLCIRGHCSAL